jgi:hypothetical protein
MAEEKMVDLDTTGEGQEVELQEEESTKEEKVQEEKVEVASEEKTEEPKDEDDSKDDGLDKYSKNVQRRIKKLLDRVEKTEQREKEALRFAESAKKKYEEYEHKIKSLDENYISEYENRVKSQIEQAKKALTDARLSNDVSAEVDAQRALTRLAIEEERALASKQQRENLEKQKEGLMAEKKESAQQSAPPPQPDPRAEQWASENEWFGKDEAMTFTALSHHKKLLKEGYDPKSDEYYAEINSHIRNEFKFNEETVEEKEKAPQIVASTSRTTKKSNSKKVKLTPSQVAIAKKLGVPLEEYAKYV